MKILISAVAVALSVLVPVAHADEASQRVIIEELLQTMKIDEMMTPVFEQMRYMLEQRFTQMGAPEDMRPILKRYTDKLVTVMEEAMGWQTLKGDIISIYVQAFTEDELRGMLEFYKSPIGRSVTAKMPAVMQQSMLLSQKRTPELLEKLKKISEELTQEIKAEMQRREKARPGNQKESRNLTTPFTGSLTAPGEL